MMEVSIRVRVQYTSLYQHLNRQCKELSSTLTFNLITTINQIITYQYPKHHVDVSMKDHDTDHDMKDIVCSITIEAKGHDKE